jgi:hypothetical protein
LAVVKDPTHFNSQVKLVFQISWAHFFWAAIILLPHPTTRGDWRGKRNTEECLIVQIQPAKNKIKANTKVKLYIWGAQNSKTQKHYNTTAAAKNHGNRSCENTETRHRTAHTTTSTHEAINWTPLPFIQETWGLGNLPNKPLPSLKFDMLNQFFNNQNFVIKNNIVSKPPNRPHERNPNNEHIELTIYIISFLSLFFVTAAINSLLFVLLFSLY